MMEETKETKEIKLTEEDVEVVKTYQQNIEKERASLGALRQNYLAAEKRVLELLSKANTDYLSYIKVLAKSKGLPPDEEWFFDPVEFSFKKMGE